MTKEELRMACYERASTIFKNTTIKTSVEKIADELVKFVGDVEWKLSALDTAIRVLNRRGTLELCLAEAGKVVEYVVVQDEPEIPVQDDRTPAKGRRQNKKRGKR